MNKSTLVLLLCFMLLSSGIKAIDAQTNAINDDRRYLITSALGSGWVTAKDDEELLNYLSRFYQGALLEDTYQACLQAREITTEWLEEVQVGAVLLLASGQDWEMVEADLTVIPGEMMTGKGYFLIEGDPGRISWATYSWDENANP